MGLLVRKSPWEEIPLNFDFSTYLADLSGATIIQIDSITADPAGDPDDLDLGVALDWTFSGLVVQTVAKKGRTGVNYDVECRATFDDDGRELRLDLSGVVLVLDEAP